MAALRRAPVKRGVLIRKNTASPSSRSAVHLSACGAQAAGDASLPRRRRELSMDTKLGRARRTAAGGLCGFFRVRQTPSSSARDLTLETQKFDALAIWKTDRRDRRLHRVEQPFRRQGQPLGLLHPAHSAGKMRRFTRSRRPRHMWSILPFEREHHRAVYRHRVPGRHASGPARASARPARSGGQMEDIIVARKRASRMRYEIDR